MNQNQRLIAKVVRNWHEAKLRRALAKKRERAEIERLSAELALMRDEVRAQGVDPDGPLGRAIVMELVARQNAQSAAARWCDDDGFPLDHD